MWKLRIVVWRDDSVIRRDLSVGDAFFFDQAAYEAQRAREPSEDDRGWYWPAIFAKKEHLSEFYWKNNAAHREPICVWMPGHTLFCVDGMCMSDGKWYGGWTVTGEPESLTVSPSINIGGLYHGWLRDGMISADCDGRQYGPDGTRLNPV